MRRTNFSLFYDAVSKATVVSTQRGTVSVDPAKPGLPTTDVKAGKELEVTAKAVSALAPIGKAGARGGVDRMRALELAAKLVGRSAKRCGIETPKDASAFSVKRGGAGWLVTIKVTGKLKGASTWTVVGAKVAPANALAKQIAAGCR